MLVTSVTVRVPAKINLQLAVGPLRPDGYHGLVTVFHAVSLFDDVTAEPAEIDTITRHGRGGGPGPGRCRQPSPPRGQGPARGDRRAGRGALVRRAVRVGRGGGGGGGSGGGAGGRPLEGRRGRGHDRQAHPGRWRHGRRQRRRRRRPRRLQRTLGHGPVTAELCAVAACRQRRGVPRPGRDRGGPRKRRVPGPGATRLPSTSTGSSPWPTATCPPRRSSARSTGNARARVPAPGAVDRANVGAGIGDPSKAGGRAEQRPARTSLALFPALRKTLDAGLEPPRSAPWSPAPAQRASSSHATRSTPPTWRATLSAAGACRSVATATGPAAGASVISSHPGTLQKCTGGGGDGGGGGAPGPRRHPSSQPRAPLPQAPRSARGTPKTNG